MKQKIQSIKSEYYAIARRLSAPKEHIRFAETPQHDGSPHIEDEGEELLYVVTERGQRYGEKRTTNPNELLFWLVSDLTWSMASNYELAHRIETEDFRRKLFSKHIELLASINPEWASKKKKEYDRILIEHPYSDRKV